MCQGGLTNEKNKRKKNKRNLSFSVSAYDFILELDYTRTMSLFSPF